MEIPPQTYKNAGTETNSPLNPILSGGTSSSINVQVSDPSLLTVTYTETAPNYNTVSDFYARKPGWVSFQVSTNNGATYTT